MIQLRNQGATSNDVILSTRNHLRQQYRDAF
jgi:hypothetical protein